MLNDSSIAARVHGLTKLHLTNSLREKFTPKKATWSFRFLYRLLFDSRSGPPGTEGHRPHLHSNWFLTPRLPVSCGRPLVGDGLVGNGRARPLRPLMRRGT